MSDHDIKALSFTKDQMIYKALADKVVKEFIAPQADETDRSGEFPVKNMRLLGEKGLLGFAVPALHGGAGGDFVSITLVLESIAKGCASTAMSFLMHVSTIPFISSLVNDEQKAKFLQPLIEGRVFGALSMSEPATGSRLWHMTSFADLQGDKYLIDSFKSFVTSSRHADFYLLPVRTSSQSKANELSVFWVEGDNEKIKFIGDWDAMGLRGSSSTPVHFDNCEIPAGNRIGAPDAGFAMLMAYTLPIYFVGMAAVYLGIAESAYNAAVQKIKSRKYADTKDGGENIESLQRYIGEMKTGLCQLRASVYRGARLVNHTTKIFDLLSTTGLLKELLDNAQKDTFFIELAQLKIAATETAAMVTEKALLACGGQGYKKGTVVERCFRDARAGALMGPSNDVLKTIIGKRELGLPYPWE